MEKTDTTITWKLIDILASTRKLLVQYQAQCIQLKQYACLEMIRDTLEKLDMEILSLLNKED